MVYFKGLTAGLFIYYFFFLCVESHKNCIKIKIYAKHIAHNIYLMVKNKKLFFIFREPPYKSHYYDTNTSCTDCRQNETSNFGTNLVNFKLMENYSKLISIGILRIGISMYNCKSRLSLIFDTWDVFNG